MELNEIKKRIIEEESAYENLLMSAVTDVTENPDIKLILISGGSCAGKTTTTKKLCGYIRQKGHGCYTLSLDDFYLDQINLPFEADGTQDLEALSSIDVDYFHECLHNLVTGKTARIPRFSFITKAREAVFDEITLKPGDIAIIEGLHALNPATYASFAEENQLYKIYLYAKSTRFTDPRFLRRLVRDYHYRASNAENTYSMWKNVKRGEEIYIEPYEKTADLSINTYFKYEKCCFVKTAKMLLSTIKTDSQYYNNARELLNILSTADEIELSNVPVNSLLQEFIKNE